MYFIDADTTVSQHGVGARGISTTKQGTPFKSQIQQFETW